MRTTAMKGIFISLTALTLSACGGGDSNDDNTSTQSLSEDQKIFEKMTLDQGGHYKADSVYLPSTGATGSYNYFTISSTKLTTSPLATGPQTVISTGLQSITSNLSAPIRATRYLIGGRIIKSSSPNYKTIIEYKNGQIINSTLSEDDSIVVSKEIRFNYIYTPLAGVVADSPEEFKRFFNFLFINPALINKTATWPDNSGYETFSIKLSNDTYYVYDYSSTTFTTDTNVIPVGENTTLENLLTTGIANDSRTYTLTDGKISTVNGVRMFIATNARQNSSTTMYRIYFEMNGNVYTGSFVPANTIQGGPVYYDTLNGSYQAKFDQKRAMRFNSSAFNGLKNAITF